MSKQPKKLRIFLSSPGDVAEERALASELIEARMRKHPLVRIHFDLELVRWDDPERPTPMEATASPQVSVDRFMGKPSDCDIVICVLWSRIGSPFVCEGRLWESGTAYELADAFEAKSKPDVFIFRCTRRIDPRRDPQLPELEAFLKEEQRIETTISYDTPTEFLRRLELTLFEVLAQRVSIARTGVHFESEILRLYGIDRKAPPAFRAGAEKFLVSYLGSLADPVPFGGRSKLFDTLDTWLYDPHTPRRHLVWGPAGSGKSAALVRWIGQLDDEFHVVFLPISIRLGTNRADLFHHALAARLAELLGEELPPTVGDPLDHYEGFAIDFLRRIDELDRPVLLIIDGLDEAAGWSVERVLPTDPSQKLRILVSARLLVGDYGAQGWLRRLGWDTGPTPSDLKVAPLDVNGVREAVLSMGKEISFDVDFDLFHELFRLTGGDPILVRLYVEDLRSRFSQQPRLRAEELRDLEPGFGPFFERWLDDQRKQWQAMDSSLDQDLIDDLLSLLACALGPLRHADLAALLRIVRDDRRMRLSTKALEPLRRFVIGDDDGEGYVLAHPKLSQYLQTEYFRDPLLLEDSRRAFAKWGHDTVAALNESVLKPADCPPYLLLWFRTHLELGNANITEFARLIENGWRLAWENSEGSSRGFAADVGAALKWIAKAIDIDDPDLHETMGTLARAAFVLASVGDVASNISSKLLIAAFADGQLSARQTLDLAKLAGNSTLIYVTTAIADDLAPALRAQALADALELAYDLDKQYFGQLVLLLTHLDPSQRAEELPRVLEKAYSLDGFWRVNALAELLPHLDTAQREEALSVALETTKAMKESSWRTRDDALALLAPCLDASERAVAFKTALVITDENPGVKAMVALAPLDPSQRAKALDVAYSIPSSSERLEALVLLAPHLESSQRAKALGDALRIARKSYVKEIARKNYTTTEKESLIVGKLSDYLSNHERDDLIQHALEVAFSLEEHEISSMLKGLVSKLNAKERDVVLQRVCTMSNEHYRADAICAMAPHLDGPQLTVAVDAARSIQREGDRTIALGGLLPHVDEERRSDLSREALDSALATVRYPRTYLHEVIALTSRLNPQQRSVALREALVSAKTIDDVAPWVRALALLAPHLDASRRAEVLRSALDKARNIRQRDKRVSAVAAIAPRLDSPERERVIEEALDMMRSMQWAIIEALIALAPDLNTEQRYVAFRETVQAVFKHQRGWWLKKDLRLLMPHLDAPNIESFWTAERCDWPLSILDLSEFAACVGAPQVAWLFAHAQSLNDKEERTIALARIAPHLGEPGQAEVLREVVEAARTLPNAEALSWLAPHLEGNERREALRVTLKACRYVDELATASILIRLAPHLDGPLLDEAVDIAKKMPKYWVAVFIRGLFPLIDPEQQLSVFCKLLTAPLNRANLIELVTKLVCSHPPLARPLAPALVRAIEDCTAWYP
jgi:hypothetical protein